MKAFWRRLWHSPVVDEIKERLEYLREIEEHAERERRFLRMLKGR